LRESISRIALAVLRIEPGLKWISDQHAFEGVCRELISDLRAQKLAVRGLDGKKISSESP
jgi:hypothetical protein